MKSVTFWHPQTLVYRGVVIGYGSTALSNLNSGITWEGQGLLIHGLGPVNKWDEKVFAEILSRVSGLSIYGMESEHYVLKCHQPCLPFCFSIGPPLTSLPFLQSIRTMVHKSICLPVHSSTMPTSPPVYISTMSTSPLVYHSTPLPESSLYLPYARNLL